MDCEQYRELISRLIDGELDSDEKTQLTQHLRGCEDCAALYEVFSALSRTVGEDLEEPPQELRYNVMAKLRRDQIWKKNYAPMKKILAAAACVAVILLAAGGILPKVLERSASTAVMDDSAARSGAADSSMYQSEYGQAAEAEDSALVDSGLVGTEAGTGTDTGKASKAGGVVVSTPAVTNNTQYSMAAGEVTPAPVPTVAPTQRPAATPKVTAPPTQKPVATVKPTVPPTQKPVPTVAPTLRPDVTPSPAPPVTVTTKPHMAPAVTETAAPETAAVPETPGLAESADEDAPLLAAAPATVPQLAAEADGAVTNAAIAAPETFIISLVGDCALSSSDALKTAENGLPLTVGEDMAYPFANTLDYFSGDELTLAALDCSLSGTAFTGSTAPASYAGVLAQGGVDFVSILDKSSTGTSSAALEGAGLKCGAQGQSQIITTANGLKVGIYTASNADEATAAAIIAQLHKDGAEYIICMLRWTDDGGYTPSDSQKALARSCITAGADLVLGSGSHLLRPMEDYEDGLILYGLGDWISGQSAAPADPDNAMVRLSVVRSADGTVSLDGYELIPCCQSSDLDAAAEGAEGFNDYRPSPYPSNSAEYERAMSKLKGQ